MNYRGKLKTERDKYLTKEEFVRLLKVSKTSMFWYMLFSLMGNLGLRVGEVVRLKIEHIDKNNLAIKIPTLKQSAIKGQSAGAIQRGIMPKVFIDMPVSSILMENLLHYIRDRKHGWLFPVKDGLHVTEDRVRKVFKHFAHKAHLPAIYSPHSLRHCKGVLAYQKFKDIRAVQTLLRHRNINSTVVYTHLDLEAKRHLVQELETLE